MTDKVCSKCGFSKPANTAYFYKEVRNRDGLQGQCRACGDLATYLRRRKARLARIEPVHMTPRDVAKTPEYRAFHNRKHTIYQRIGRARQQGRLHALPRLYAWLEEIKRDWYARVNR